jgi:hypothetical protein
MMSYLVRTFDANGARVYEVGDLEGALRFAELRDALAMIQAGEAGELMGQSHDYCRGDNPAEFVVPVARLELQLLNDGGQPVGAPEIHTF